MDALIFLPCLDSPERAAQCQEVLAISRERAAELGRSAVTAARTGVYPAANGQAVEWRTAVARACAAQRSIPPEESLPSPTRRAAQQTQVQVANETTLAAARRLVESGERVLALNFANGVRPGGGLLTGAPSPMASGPAVDSSRAPALKRRSCVARVRSTPRWTAIRCMPPTPHGHNPIPPTGRSSRPMCRCFAMTRGRHSTCLGRSAS